MRMQRRGAEIAEISAEKTLGIESGGGNGEFDLTRRRGARRKRRRKTRTRQREEAGFTRSVGGTRRQRRTRKVRGPSCAQIGSPKPAPPKQSELRSDWVGRQSSSRPEPCPRNCARGATRNSRTSFITNRKSTRLNSSHLGISYAV